jgi:hypothetical protein
LRTCMSQRNRNKNGTQFQNWASDHSGFGMLQFCYWVFTLFWRFQVSVLWHF